MDNFQNSQSLGPYRIISELGGGGMSMVFKAYHPTMDRYVAIKVLIHQYANDAGFRRRFQQEVRLLSKLEHPHILAVYDCGETPSQTPEGIPANVPYLVMRFLEGGTLKEYLQTQTTSSSISPALQKNTGLPLDVIDQFFTQLADALQYAHEQGIIHRDIKPGNIMVDKRGNVFLTDFGIAKLMEDTMQLTPSGAITGTPAYMSPEQAGGETLDFRSDIYSVGIVLYELLTGRIPYEAQTPVTALQRKLTEPLPSPRAINANISPLMEAVLNKALAKSRDDRFASMQEFLVAWKQAVSTKAGQGPVSATQPQKAHSPREEFKIPLPEARSRPNSQNLPAKDQPAPEKPAPPNQDIINDERPKVPLWSWLIGLVVFLCVVVVGVSGIFVANTLFVGKGETTGTPLAQIQQTSTVHNTLPSATVTPKTTPIQSVETLRSSMTLESAGTPSPEITLVEDITPPPSSQTTPSVDVTVTTAVVQAGSETLIFGPQKGSWEHKPNTEVQLFSSGSKLSNFYATVTFSVPYTTTIGTWDTGIIFRTTGDNDGYGLVIRGGGKDKNTWELLDCSLIECRTGKFTQADTQKATLKKGIVNSLDTTTSKANQVVLIMSQDLGILIVNNFYSGDFTLPKNTNSGDILIGSAFYKESEKVLGSYPTDYKDFKIWNIPLVHEPSAGQLLHSANNEIETGLKTQVAKVNLRNFIAKATFSVPYEAIKGLWNIGFVFRSQAENDQFKLFIQSDSLWRFGNKVSDQTLTTWLTQNKASYLRLGRSEKNTLILVALNEKSLFFVNGYLIAKPDLTSRTNSGDIGVGTGFQERDQIDGYQTDFEDFTIWELP